MISIIKNFVERLNEDKLIFVLDRVRDNLQDDLYDFLSVISEEYKDIDKLLISAKDVNVFYSIIDDIKRCSELEIRKRNIAV